MNTPTNYHDFRKVFLEEASARGLSVVAIQHRGLSPSGKPLFTDVAHSKINTQLPTIVHISGCHGIEGYIGSAIQTEILKSLEGKVPSPANLVFVHALNAWGMAWYRRVNAHNVDLNRNYFPPGKERPTNSEFEHFAPLFEKRPQMKKWKIWRRVLFAILKMGFRKATTVVAQGQYHLPESLFFGGQHLEPEISEVIRVLKSLQLGNGPIIVVDVHSGLGKFASENWLLDGNNSDTETAFWQKILESPVIDPKADKNFYQADGLLSSAFRHSFAENKITHIFEEFGTRSKLKVLRTMAHEHKSFLKLKLDRERAFMMIACYFPYEKDWRLKCVEKGKESFHRIIKGVVENATF